MSSVDVLNQPNLNNLHFGFSGDSNSNLGNSSSALAQPSADGFGATQGKNAVNYGGSCASEANADSSQSSGQNASSDDDLMKKVSDLVTQLIQSQFLDQLLQAFSDFLQKNQNSDSSGDSDNGGGVGGVGGQQAVSKASAAPSGQDVGAPDATPAAAPAASATPSTASTDSTQPATQAAATPTAPANPAAANDPTTQSATPALQNKAVDNTDKSASAASTGDGPTGGSGPRTLNIKNTQDHDIKVAQFDKNENKVAEITIPKGQTGHMKYENDTTALFKQADADGKYESTASRLEAYNGFVNVSYIDGHSNSIKATDGKGFNIGDSESVNDKASSEISKSDSAGDKTTTGWYDGSTGAMQKGGAFLTSELGTGNAYEHPDDDKLGAGNNPMRSTDSMTLEVEFGKG